MTRRTNQTLQYAYSISQRQRADDDMHETRVPALLKTVAQWAPNRWLRIHTEGAENIPKAGPVVIAARHYHHLYDGIALLRAVPRPVHLVVTLDWVETRPARRLMTRLTALARWPVVTRGRRNGGGVSARTTEGTLIRGVRGAVQLLKEGGVLAIFPEGYPNIDPHFTPKRSADEFLPFQYGFARIAALASRQLRARIPIVPAGFGCHQRSSREVTIRFGQPLFEEEPREEFVKRVEAEVVRLSR